MSNVIQFLETLGKNPALNPLSPADYAAAVATLDIDHLQRQALLAHDHAALSDLLGGRAQMYCLVVPAENEPQQDQDDAEGDEEPDQKDDSPDSASLN